MFYRYNNNFNLILLISQFEGLEMHKEYKPVHKKIYWPTENKYNHIHPSPSCYGLDIDDRLENISSEIEDIIGYLKMIKDYIPAMLYVKFCKDIDNLTNNYQS
ncbi:20492_t:CDS:1 [Cetraspora pellucida]|uniref:20492_t:CDS:1 n=1 Tax=Cetraspora pellucida TaxID=1433469 RepID=A0A9N9I3D8_9GLOM|nr:20492_t:CDS:1 [Cetraspora pellucida]